MNHHDEPTASVSKPCVAGRSLPGTGAVSICMLVACLAVLQALPRPATGQDEAPAIDLRPKWHEGQTSRFEVSTERVQRRAMSMAGQRREQQMTIETAGEITWRVRQVNADGAATCEMTIDWLTLTMRSEGQQQVNDSRRGSGDTAPVHDLLRAMAGTPIEVRVAADGSIQGVSGVDAIRRQMQVQEMAPQDIDLIENASKLATLLAAPADAEPGYQWQVPNRWRHEMGFLHKNMSWRLEGVEYIADIPVATVLGQGSLDLEVDDADIPPDAPPIDVRLREGSVRTQVMFDLQRGETVGRNSVQNTLIEITVRMPQQTMRQEVEQRVQSQLLRIAEE